MKFSVSLRCPILQVVKKILGEILSNFDISWLELDQKTFFLSPDLATTYYEEFPEAKIFLDEFCPVFQYYFISKNFFFWIAMEFYSLFRVHS